MVSIVRGMLSSSRLVRAGRPVLLLIATLSLGEPAAFESLEEGDLLRPGDLRECPIAAGEAHVYRVDALAAPLLITVEQRGIDLAVETRGPGEQKLLSVDTSNGRWGSEIVLLPAEVAGEFRVEIRSGQRFVVPGRYALHVEELSTDQEAPYIAALAATIEAGQLPRRTAEEGRRAMTAYRETFAAWRALGERRWEAEVLTIIAALERQSQPKAAVEDYLQVVSLWHDLGEPHREAAALKWLGVVYLRSGDMAAARETQEKAAALWHHLGERAEETETRNELCFLEQSSGALPAAFDCYQQVYGLYRDLGDRLGAAMVLNNLGGIHDSLGAPDAALARYEEALVLRREIGDRFGESQTLMNIAVVYRTLGNWQEALRHYDQARGILTDLGDRSQEAAFLNNLGFTYSHLGDPQLALSFLEDALRLRRETGDRRGEVTTLNNLGRAWRSIGDLDKALSYHRHALEIAADLGDRSGKAISRLRLAEVELDRGDAAAALRELEPGLADLEGSSPRGEAQALFLKGRALALAGKPREALPVLQDVLARRRSLRDGVGEADALQALAMAERSLGLVKEARAHAEAAVVRVEELRTGVVSPDLRAAFLSTQHRAYTLLIDLLMDRHAVAPAGGHDREALAVSERARARSLLDVLYSGGSAQAASVVPVTLRERRRSLRYRLSAKAEQLVRRTDDGKRHSLERELDTLQAELDGVEAEIRRLDPRYAAILSPRDLGVEEIARLLDPGTLLLEYALGEERSYLWAVGQGFFRSYRLPPEKEIAALARQLHGELSTFEAGNGGNGGNGGRGDAAEALSRILLGPVWPEAARARRLIIVPDAALHILPFVALPVPGAGGRLLDQAEIAYVPSAATLAFQRQRLERRSPASRWAAVLADPVFTADDPRLAGPSAISRQAPARAATKPGLPEEATLSALVRLPGTRREAEEIAALAPAGQVWTALSLEANREAVLSGRLRDYRIVHFATHALVNTMNPELSGLMLSQVAAAGELREGFLSLADIYELELHADLAVLSGCQTALGKELRGEGIMGLTRGFLFAGAPRVVASLWPVQDRTTAELMTRFYRALWQKRLPPAAALRDAQQSLRRNPRYRDAYSWAGFVLQGDWR